MAAAILSLRLSDEIANLRGGGELDGTSEHDKSDEDGQKSAEKSAKKKIKKMKAKLRAVEAKKRKLY